MRRGPRLGSAVSKSLAPSRKAQLRPALILAAGFLALAPAASSAGGYGSSPRLLLPVGMNLGIAKTPGLPMFRLGAEMSLCFVDDILAMGPQFFRGGYVDLVYSGDTVSATTWATVGPEFGWVVWPPVLGIPYGVGVDVGFAQRIGGGKGGGSGGQVRLIWIALVPFYVGVRLVPGDLPFYTAGMLLKFPVVLRK